MNTAEIRVILRKICKDSFLGVFARDRLPTKLPPRRPLMLVCNTDAYKMPGKHWIVIYIGEDSQGEYFDSAGAPPLREFASFLDIFSNSWTFNDIKLQSVISFVCGHYCIMYCILRYLNYDMFDIVACFTDDTALNDTIAHNFVCSKVKNY